MGRVMRIALTAWAVSSGLSSAQVVRSDDPLGKQLNAWFAEGSAAGLGAVTYENRDGGHSQLTSSDFPQLKVYTPTAEEKEKKRDLGLAGVLRPMVLFGNCSMAAPADKGGSLPRFYLNDNTGTTFLAGQYLDNNLFFYPCHQDHSPGWNGVRGWGDLFPANTTCTVISQGSSFTDQPFLRAFLTATSALSPETQSALIRTRMLMPTLQALFRHSNRRVKSDADYFTGAAHPVVFSGDQIDTEKFVRLAHELKLSDVPPVPLLLTVREAPACVPGRDFFELPEVTNETLANSPCTISRIFRSAALKHEMVVSARRTVELEKKPLQMKWVLLQGDPSRVKIEPADNGMEAKITVAWHPEMRLPSGLATRRVDIGVFASNGGMWSAPSFVSFYMLPNEARFYRKDGRLEEICYEAGNPDVGLPGSEDFRWLSLGRSLASSPKLPGNQLLLQVLPKEAVKALVAMANELEPRQTTWRHLDADPSSKKEADTALIALREQTRKRLEVPLAEGKEPLRALVEKALNAVADTPDLFVSLQEPLTGMAREAGKLDDFAAARKRALNYQVLVETAPGQFALNGKVKELTSGDRAQLRSLHLTVLATALLPNFLERSNDPLWVDPRLTLIKSWRDVYVYDKDGTTLGWTRITNGREYLFDSIGRLLPEGRKGAPVETLYLRDGNRGRLVFATK